LRVRGVRDEEEPVDRLGIEPISVFGMPPVPYIELAADLGLRYIAIMLTAMPNSYGYPPFSLKDDRELRRQTLAALHDRGVSIALGEGMVVREDTDMRDLATDIAVMGELGAHRVNTMSFDADRNRTIDRFGAVAELAAAAGMETTFEFGPTKPVGRTLSEGVEIIRAVGRRDFRLLIDTMHLVRSGSGAEDVAALDPELIGHVQLADAPLVPTIPDYMEEACFERMVPGTGELPLVDILAALPSDVVIGLEVPLRSQADLGIGPHERLGRCVDAARALLALSDQARP
jgi:sugar phosphate isomerase/epimerase